MKHRFTMKNLEEFSDKQILMVLLNERLSELHPYSILGLRLEKIEVQVRKEMDEDAMD